MIKLPINEGPMKRTTQDIRENLDFVGCDNETARELCDEVDRLTAILERVAEANIIKEAELPIRPTAA